jgi:hypothetical protein
MGCTGCKFPGGAGLGTDGCGMLGAGFIGGGSEGVDGTCFTDGAPGVSAWPELFITTTRLMTDNGNSVRRNWFFIKSLCYLSRKSTKHSGDQQFPSN